MARRCPGCDTIFNVDRQTSRQVYCSKSCREENRQKAPVQRVCPVCQTEFTTDVSPRRIFCSKVCRTTARNSETEQEERKCPVCDGTFEAPKTVRQIYCAPSCRRAAERQRDDARDQDRARRLGHMPKPATEPKALNPIEPPPLSRPPTLRPAVRHPQGRDPLEPTATRDCPHCHQPITIVALLATPEAARPSVPIAPPEAIPMRRTP